MTASPASFVVALAVLALAADASAQQHVVGQVTVRERLVIRVPARIVVPRPIAYRERKGPRCIAASEIAGAVVADGATVDFVLRGGARVRARLEGTCPALDYYTGFYLRPGKDGQICRSRDAVHSRSGGECAIDRLRSLEPIPPK